MINKYKLMKCILHIKANIKYFLEFYCSAI